MSANKKYVSDTPGKIFPLNGSLKNKLISLLSHNNFYLPHWLTYHLFLYNVLQLQCVPGVLFLVAVFDVWDTHVAVPWCCSKLMSIKGFWKISENDWTLFLVTKTSEQQGNWKWEHRQRSWNEERLPFFNHLVSGFINMNRGKSREQECCPKISKQIPASGSDLFQPHSLLLPCSRCGSQTSSIHITRELKK